MVFLVPIVMSGFALPGTDGSLAFSEGELVKLSMIITLALVSLVAWATDLLRRGGVVRRTPVEWLILAWLVWVGVCTLLAVHPPTSLLGAQGRFEGLVAFVVYSLVYFLALQFVGEEGRTLRLAQVLFCSSLVVALYGLLQYTGVVLLPDELPWMETERAFSTYGNPNMLGGFLVFPVTISLGLALRERVTWLRLIYWAGFGLNAFALVVTFTRGAWIGGFVGVLLISVIAWRQRAKLRRLDLVPGGLFGAAAVAVIVRSLSSSNDATNIGKRLSSLFQTSTGSGQTRTEIWQAAADAIKERPLFGWGPDTFGLVFSKFKPAEYVRDAGGSSVADNAHDYPLHLAAGVGIAGVLLFFAIWVWAGLRSCRVVFGRATGAPRLPVGAFWAAAAGYLLHLLFGISVPGATFLLWIALAVVLAPTARTVTVPRRRWGGLTASLIAIAAAAAITGQAVVLAADRAEVIAADDFSGLATAERIAMADLAVRLNPLVSKYRSTAASVRTAQMRSDAAALAQVQRQGDDAALEVETLSRSFEEAESAYLRAIDFTPYDYANYVNLAAVYNLAGATLDREYYQEAIATADRGLEVVPLATELRERLASAYVATGRTDKAIEVLEYCVGLDSADASAALALAKLYQDRGRVEEAIAVLETVEARAPGQVLIATAIEVLKRGDPLP